MKPSSLHQQRDPWCHLAQDPQIALPLYSPHPHENKPSVSRIRRHYALLTTQYTAVQKEQKQEEAKVEGHYSEIFEPQTKYQKFSIVRLAELCKYRKQVSKMTDFKTTEEVFRP